MSATLSGTAIRFTPLAGPTAPASQAILQVIQSEPLLSRTYYQDGRLLTATDLNRDYAYLDQRLLGLGLALGDGIVSGLAATLPDGVTITVTQGRGIAPSGRVIGYAAADPTALLTASLADAATQASLNGAGFAGITDGLYAVVLLHAQQPSGLTEVFPRDLSALRPGYDTIIDTVEIALIGLPQPVPAGTQYQARAQLAAQFAAAQSPPALPSDSLALGVLAMRNGLASWFDPSLLRHRLRAADAPTAAQDDLAAAYQQIYADLMASLAAAGQAGFRAADVFPLLPSTGLLPAVTVNVAAATQTFFPDQIGVSLVPARADEVAALLAQAAGEPPVNLAAAATAQIMVLVPLPPATYATLAPSLLGAAPSATAQAFAPYPTVALPRIDPLLLRLPGRFPPPPTQPDIWAQIFQAAPANLPWLVCPSNGGAGGALAAQLAAGFAVPSPPPAASPPVPIRPPPVTPAPVTITTAAPTTTPASTPAPFTTPPPAPTATTTPAPTTTPPPTTTPAPTTLAPTTTPLPTNAPPTTAPAPTLTPVITPPATPAPPVTPPITRPIITPTRIVGGPAGPVLEQKS